MVTGRRSLKKSIDHGTQIHKIMIGNKQQLVGGFKHVLHVLFSIIYGMSSFPLTFIFFRMVKTNNQATINNINILQQLLGYTNIDVENQWFP